MIAAESAPALRRMPYPFRALLAICSDLDETPDAELFVETSRFLNTTTGTRLGPGLGLEVGNTIYFDMPPGQFSYWNTDESGRRAVHDLIASGHIDCLHSYGDLAATRAHAARALEALDRHGCRLGVWIDHAVAPTNFGADIMLGSGDVAGSPAYHADLTCDFGVRYVWRGRITSVIGQGVGRRLAGLFNAGHPVASARTLAKETAKGMAARLGSQKYGLHAPNAVLTPATLRDGRPVHEFLRANPHWGGVSSRDTAAGIGDVLNASLITRLVAREGTCILYTHLGKLARPRSPFTAAGIRGLTLLAEAERTGHLKVLTTRRLLDYSYLVDHLQWATSVRDGAIAINVRVPLGLTPADLRGVTFYTPDPERTRMFVDGCEYRHLSRNPADHTGRCSVSVPWDRLTFPIH